MKPKYGEITTLCYMDTESFRACIKTKKIHVEIAKDVEGIS